MEGEGEEGKELKGGGDFTAPDGTELVVVPLAGEDEVEAEKDHGEVAAEHAGSVPEGYAIFLDKSEDSAEDEKFICHRVKCGANP